MKEALEKPYKTIVYFHECPYCGDLSDAYEESLENKELACFCGEKYRVVKKKTK